MLILRLLLDTALLTLASNSLLLGSAWAPGFFPSFKDIMMVTRLHLRTWDILETLPGSW